MIKHFLLFCAAFLTAQPAAAADWLRGESENYIIHAKVEESRLRELLQLVEDVDRLLDSQLPAQTRSGRKLQVYLEDNYRRISSVSKFNNIGFVVSNPEISASFALYDPSDDSLFRHYTLFYAQTRNHIDNSFFRPNPIWVKNGVPLFFATTYVDDDGNFILGAPDIRRPMKGSVTASKLRKMLTTEIAPDSQANWTRFSNLSREAVNPLLIEPDYGGLLETYLNAYAAGQTMEEAAASLGDIDTLAKQIEDRRRTGRPTFRRVGLETGEPNDMAIRPMTPAEIALTQPRFRRLSGREEEKAAKRLKSLTEKFPSDAPVWYEYAAAEFARVQTNLFGGNKAFRGFGFSNGVIVIAANPYSDAAAWDAVNRALALDPQNRQALRLKAEILMSRIVRSGDTGDAAGFDKVREMLAPMATDPEREPLAAALMHQSYIEQGIEPPQQVRERLGRAFVANPAVEAFRYAYAVSLAQNGQKEIAERLLTSMLNNPEYRDAARRALGET